MGAFFKTQIKKKCNYPYQNNKEHGVNFYQTRLSLQWGRGTHPTDGVSGIVIKEEAV